MSDSPYRPPAAPVGDPAKSAGELKHSGLGIASFVISILSGILMFLLFAIAGVVGATTPGGMDEKSMVAIVIGLSLFAGLFVALLALGLGIGGLLQKERRKLFAILGTVASAATILGAVALLALGLAMK